MNSTIGYKGKVTIKVKNKPPITVKNTATKSLFEALTKALALCNNFSREYYEAVRDAMPTFAQIYCFDAAWDGASPLPPHYRLLNPIPIVRSQCSDNDQGDPCVKHSFYLTRSNLWSKLDETSEEQLEKYSYLVLLNSEQEVLAFINIDLSTSDDLPPPDATSGSLNIKTWDTAQQAAITWELSFTNITESTPQQGDNE